MTQDRIALAIAAVIVIGVIAGALFARVALLALAIKWGLS